MNTKYFLAVYRDPEGNTHTDIYTDDMEGWEQYHRDTFSPDTETLELIRYQATGKTYKDRKADAAEKARETQEVINTSVLYWSQVATLSDIMGTYAKRYGLTREFTENGII